MGTDLKVKRLRQVVEWVGVEHELPDPHHPVIAVHRDPRYSDSLITSFAYMTDDGRWRASGEDGEELFGVRLWMAMPKSPFN
jgi:hypothetical protein